MNLNDIFLLPKALFKMIIAQYLVWDPNPIILTLGPLKIVYYGLLFALGFLISQQILFYMFKKEGKSEKDVEVLTIYMVIATIIGARLGHVFFYEPAVYLADPIKILKINEGGLASHGAAAGILLALYLYSRNKKGQSYFWVLDRLVIVIALTGALIRFGNFINSEIIGLPTNSDTGVVFGRQIEEGVEDYFAEIEDAEVSKANWNESEEGKAPMELKLTFFKGQYGEEAIRSYIENSIGKRLITYNTVDEPHTFIDPMKELDYSLTQSNGQFTAVINLFGIPRHPAQLYESFSCILLFFFLFALWNKWKENTPEGLIFGIFLIVIFGLRFLYEFLKENQVGFEDNLALNMGQWLSIPLVIAGVIITVYVLQTNKGNKTIEDK